MTRPAKPWTEMSPTEKREAIKVRILAGKSWREIGDELSIESRNSIAGVVNRLRQLGELPPAKDRRVTGAGSGTIAKVKARKRRARQPKPEPTVTVSASPKPKTHADIIVLPRASSPATTSAMIDVWLKKNGGPRRFEANTSTDLHAIKFYVAKHGFELLFTQRGKQPYTIRGGRGRPRSFDKTQLFAFVDDLRIADGLQPFTPKETGHGKSA